jgi:hypothetical protein
MCIIQSITTHNYLLWITRSSTKGSSITESTAATEPLKIPSPTAAESNNTPSGPQISLIDVELALSPTTGCKDAGKAVINET